MNCNRYNDERILFAYDESNDAAFAKHLETCVTCQNEVSAYRVAFAGTRALPEAPAPSLSNDRLRQAILSAELKPRLSPWFLRLGTAGASAAAIVAVWLAVGKGLENTTVPDFMDKPSEPVAVAPPKTEPVEENNTSAFTNTEPIQNPAPIRRSRKAKRTTTVVKTPMPDLVAVAGSGATEAVEVFSEAPRTEAPAMSLGSAAAKDAGVILIQPDGSGANERSSSDVAIGG